MVDAAGFISCHGSYRYRCKLEPGDNYRHLERSQSRSCKRLLPQHRRMGDFHDCTDYSGNGPSVDQPRVQTFRTQGATPVVSFLKQKALLVLTILIVAQTAIYYLLVNRSEYKPEIAPLTQFVKNFAGWSMAVEIPMEKEVAEVLKADDTITRVYTKPDGGNASLYVAFFRSQRSGVAPHSPKNCLPGNGWVTFRENKKLLDVPGRAMPMEVNHYTI